MNHSTQKKYLLTFGLICLLTFLSCRKKDERYEGVYAGTERHYIFNSIVEKYVMDTSYHQEFELTYFKHHYIFLKLFNNPYGSEFAVDRKDIIDHEYYPFSEEYYDTDGNLILYYSYIKFSDGNLHYFDSSRYNGIVETWEFVGKRN